MSELSRKRQRASTEPSRLYTQRRKTMIKAAAEVFREKGLSETSLNDVSQSIGVERASLYYYFGSKEQLFRAVILESTEEVVDRALTISAGPGTPRARLTEVITHIVSSFNSYYPSLHIYVQEDMRRVRSRDDPDASAEHQRLAELADLYMATLEDLIREGIASGDFREFSEPRVTAQMLQGSLNWMHRWFTPGSVSETEDLAAVFVTFLLDGLASPSSGDGLDHRRRRAERVSP